MRDDFSNIIPLYEICIRCIRQFSRDKKRQKSTKLNNLKQKKDKQDKNKAKSKCANQRFQMLKAYAL